MLAKGIVYLFAVVHVVNIISKFVSQGWTVEADFIFALFVFSQNKKTFFRVRNNCSAKLSYLLHTVAMRLKMYLEF